MKIQTIGQELRTSNKQNYNRQPAFRRNWSEHVSWGANYVKETGKTNFKLFSFPDAKAVFVEVAGKVASHLGNIRERVVQVVATAGAALQLIKFYQKMVIQLFIKWSIKAMEFMK